VGQVRVGEEEAAEGRRVILPSLSSFRPLSRLHLQTEGKLGEQARLSVDALWVGWRDSGVPQRQAHQYSTFWIQVQVQVHVPHSGDDVALGSGAVI
jgi:hypothetical protein